MTVIVLKFNHTDYTCYRLSNIISNVFIVQMIVYSKAAIYAIKLRNIQVHLIWKYYSLSGKCFILFSLKYLRSQTNIDQHDHEQSWPQGGDRKFRHNFWVYNKSQTRTCKNIPILIRVSRVIIGILREIITNGLNFVLCIPLIVNTRLISFCRKDY